MNTQHSSRSDSWGTPYYIMVRVRKVLGPIDFDPASSLYFNENVQAEHFFTELGLEREWLPGAIYLNPPGGKIRNKSQAQLFWSKLMKHREQCPGFSHAIFMGFNIEQLQTTQRKGVHCIAEFPFCIPAERIKFLGNGNAPTHSNVIVYVPGLLDKTQEFERVFSYLGAVCNA